MLTLLDGPGLDAQTSTWTTYQTSTQTRARDSDGAGRLFS